MSFTLGDNQVVTATIAQTDADGNPTPFITAPTLAVDDPTLVVLAPVGTGIDAAGTSSFTIQPTNPVGTPSKLGVATVTVTNVDNPSISAQIFQVSVVAEAPSQMQVSFGTPTERTS